MMKLKSVLFFICSLVLFSCNSGDDDASGGGGGGGPAPDLTDLLPSESSYLVVNQASASYTSGLIDIYNSDFRKVVSVHKSHSDLKVSCSKAGDLWPTSVARGLFVMERSATDALAFYGRADSFQLQWQISTNQHPSLDTENQLTSANIQDFVPTDRGFFAPRLGSNLGWYFWQLNIYDASTLDFNPFAPQRRALADVVGGVFFEGNLYVLLGGYDRSRNPWEFNDPQIMSFTYTNSRVNSPLRVHQEPRRLNMIRNPLFKMIPYTWAGRSGLMIAGQGNLMSSASNGAGIIFYETSSSATPQVLVSNHKVTDMLLVADELFYIRYISHDQSELRRYSLTSRENRLLERGAFSSLALFEGDLIVAQTSGNGRGQIMRWHPTRGLQSIVTLNMNPQQIMSCD